jgi:hypothetical protein
MMSGPIGSRPTVILGPSYHTSLSTVGQQFLNRVSKLLSA